MHFPEHAAALVNMPAILFFRELRGERFATVAVRNFPKNHCFYSKTVGPREGDPARIQKCTQPGNPLALSVSLSVIFTEIEFQQVRRPTEEERPARQVERFVYSTRKIQRKLVLASRATIF